MPKITELPAAAAVTTDDLVPVVDSPAAGAATKKATVAQVRAALMPVSLATDVTGTLPSGNGGTGKAAADLTANPDKTIVVNPAGTAYDFATVVDIASPTGNAGKVLAVNAAGTAIDYGYDKHLSNLVAASKPRVGDTTPYASEGRATQAMANANQTLGASIYSRQTVKTTGANTLARTATHPHPPSEDASCIKVAQNDCTNRNTVHSTGTGTTVSLPPNSRALLAFTPDGVSSAINTVDYLQFAGADADRLPTTYGVIRVDPYNTRDIISTRLEDNSGDVVLLSHWVPAAGKNELCLGNGQQIGTQVHRLVLSAADFSRALIGSTTVWRAEPAGLQLFSNTVDFGGGGLVIGIKNAQTNPTTNPTGGIVLYVDSADNTLKYRKADGSTVSLSGGGGTPGGSNTQVQFNDSSAFGGDAGLTYNKTTDVLSVGAAVAVGTTPAGAGLLRFPYSTSATLLGVKNSAAADAALLSQTAGDTYQLGMDGAGVRINGGTVAIWYNGNARIAVGPSLIESAVPRVGSLVPYASEGRAAQAMADANQTPAAAVYSRALIRCTGALTAARTLTLPHPASEDESYRKCVDNATTGGFNITVSTGTGTTANVPAGVKSLWFTPGGVQLVA